MRQFRICFYITSIFILTLNACAPSPESLAAQTSTAQTAKAAAWTATATATATATNTLTPTATSTSTPTATLTPTPQYPVLPGTPLPPTAGVISKDNLRDLIVLSGIGKGQAGDIAYLPDGSALAIHTNLGIYLYDSDTYQEIQHFTTDSMYITPNLMSISPDGTHMAGSYLSASTIEIWSTDQTTPKTVFETKSDACQSVEIFDFTPENNLVLACVVFEQPSSKIQIWDTEQGALQASFDVPLDLTHGGMAVSPDGKLLALAEAYGKIELWDLVNGEKILTYSTSTDGYRYPSVSFFEDGTALSVISRKQALILSTDADSAIYSAKIKPRRSVGYSGFKDVLLINNQVQNTLQVLSLPSEEEINFFDNFDQGIDVFGISPDQRHLAVISKGITIFDISSGEKIVTLNEFPGFIQNLTFSSNNSILAASESATHFYQTNNASLMKVYQGASSAFSMAFISDNEVLRIGYSDISTISLETWDAEVLVEDTNFYSSALSPDQQTVYYADSEGKIYQYDLKERYSQRLITVDPQNPQKIVLSESGRFMAVLYIDYQNPQAKQPIKIFEFTEAGLVQIDEAQFGMWVYDITFSPDERFLLVSVNETLHVWGLENSELAFEEEWGLAYDITFDPSGAFLAATGETHLRFWSFSPDGVDLLDELPLPNIFTLTFSEDGTMLAAGGPGKLYLLGIKDW